MNKCEHKYLFKILWGGYLNGKYNKLIKLHAFYFENNPKHICVNLTRGSLGPGVTTKWEVLRLNQK